MSRPRFEPGLLHPESDALTTRPHCHIYLILNNITVKIDVTKKHVTGEIRTIDCTGTMFIELIL